MVREKIPSLGVPFASGKDVQVESSSSLRFFRIGLCKKEGHEEGYDFSRKQYQEQPQEGLHSSTFPSDSPGTRVACLAPEWDTIT